MAQNILMRRRGGTLVPANSEAAYVLEHVPDGNTVEVRMIRGRSTQQHRLFWAVLDRVAQASRFETAERLLVAIKVSLGRYDLCKLPSGKVVPVPQSISFAAMDQHEFQKFMDDAFALICRDVLPHMTPDDLAAWVNEGKRAA